MENSPPSLRSMTAMSSAANATCRCPTTWSASRAWRRRSSAATCRYVVRQHPDAPLPAVLLDAPLLDTAVTLRQRLGDAAFFGLLGKPGDAGWGDLATGWDAARFEAALTAPPGAPERIALVSVLQDALSGFAELARSAGTGFVDIDDGLAAISQHAASLGYDALVLFLDELILWFATQDERPSVGG